MTQPWFLVKQTYPPHPTRWLSLQGKEYTETRTNRDKLLQGQPNSVFRLGVRFGEAPTGFEPVNQGFANLCLTTWLRRHHLISAQTGLDLNQLVLWGSIDGVVDVSTIHQIGYHLIHTPIHIMLVCF